MANRDMLHQFQWALKTFFCPWETKKSVTFCTKILEFILAFHLHLKYLGLGLVEKMSIALPICRECGAAVQGLGKTKVYRDCGLEGTLFLKAIRDVLSFKRITDRQAV